MILNIHYQTAIKERDENQWNSVKDCWDFNLWISSQVESVLLVTLRESI